MNLERKLLSHNFHQFGNLQQKDEETSNAVLNEILKEEGTNENKQYDEDILGEVFKMAKETSKADLLRLLEALEAESKREILKESEIKM